MFLEKNIGFFNPVVLNLRLTGITRIFKSLYATYREAEDLINIGAYAPGSNPRIDRAIALIEPMRTFLRQSVGERCTLAQTRNALLSLLSCSQTQKASPARVSQTPL